MGENGQAIPGNAGLQLRDGGVHLQVDRVGGQAETTTTSCVMDTLSDSLKH